MTAPASSSGSLFGGGGSSGQQQDEGAGVVYNDNGYILTDQHVVAGATSIKVTFQDGLSLRRSWSAPTRRPMSA